jgi:hypothetical protein
MDTLVSRGLNSIWQTNQVAALIVSSADCQCFKMTRRLRKCLLGRQNKTKHNTH